MKRIIPFVLALGIMMLSACKEKKQSDDIITTKYVPKQLQDPIGMPADNQSQAVEWGGATYQVSVSRVAADSLRAVSDDVVSQGYRLKIYDAYRPQMGVDNFVRWAENVSDTLMKAYFYPDLDKSVLFEQEYIYEKSGHTRGSTVDLTLFDMQTEKELDMGGTFDWFGPESHPDFCGNPETAEYTGDNSKSPAGRSITPEQFANRMILREAMLRHGFKPIDSEWWHFTLKDEPFPDTYFTFPVKQL